MLGKGPLTLAGAPLILLLCVLCLGPGVGVAWAAGDHPELPNLIKILLHYSGADTTQGIGWFFYKFTPMIFSLLVVALVGYGAYIGTRQLRDRPGKLQNLIELVVEGLYVLVVDVIGEKHARRFVPFLGSLFLFIWFNNMFGLLGPVTMAPTSKYQTTFALAFVVICYVQYVAITGLGLKGYLHHLAGEPQDVVTWIMAPLFLVLHIVGEIAKPISLSLRLFGNILGEDILLGVFMVMGIMLFGAATAWTGLGLERFMGFPLHFPFYFLALLLGTIQALVFTLLSAIYILLVLPHEHEDEAH